MTKALITFGTGQHAQMLKLAMPLFKAYAKRHGYDLLIPGEIPTQRPASWYKVQCLQSALETYNEALWIDCDVVIADGSLDFADQVPADCWQGLVAHHTNDGEVPNCGIWFVRQPMSEILNIVWNMRQYTQHVWWEQAAMLQLLGYDPNTRPCQRINETALYGKTHFLPLEWNSHEGNDRAATPRFAHITPNLGLGWRLATMQAYVERAEWL